MKPLKTNKTIPKYKRAKEMLERFHRRDKRRREEEVQEEEAANLQRLGITTDDFQFDDSLSDPSDIEEQYGNSIAALLPSRPNRPGHDQMQIDDDDNGDEVRIFDDDAGREVVPPSPMVPPPQQTIPSLPHAMVLPRSPVTADSSLNVSELLRDLLSKDAQPLPIPSQRQAQPMEIGDSAVNVKESTSGSLVGSPQPTTTTHLVEPFPAHPHSPNTDSSSSPHRVSERMAGLDINPVQHDDPQAVEPMKHEEESESSDRFTAAQNDQLGNIFQ